MNLPRKYNIEYPQIDGMVPVKDAADMLGVSRARIYQLSKSIQESLRDSTRPDNYLVLACPLEFQPREGKRPYGTNWVTLSSINDFKRGNRLPGPKGIRIKDRMRRDILADYA